MGTRGIRQPLACPLLARLGDLRRRRYGKLFLEISPCRPVGSRMGLGERLRDGWLLWRRVEIGEKTTLLVKDGNLTVGCVVGLGRGSWSRRSDRTDRNNRKHVD